MTSLYSVFRSQPISTEKKTSRSPAKRLRSCLNEAVKMDLKKIIIIDRPHGARACTARATGDALSLTVTQPFEELLSRDVLRRHSTRTYVAGEPSSTSGEPDRQTV